MKVEPLNSFNGRLIDGPLLFSPKIYRDERGCFYESWNSETFESSLTSHGASSSMASSLSFVQDNQSESFRGVLRGLHFQLPARAQGKLIRCTYGEIFDVAVDLRKSSNTFGDWIGVFLSARNHHQLWVPEGFAHGFLTLSKFAITQYKVTSYWCSTMERSLLWSDSQLSVEWPLESINLGCPILSRKDASAPSLRMLDEAGELFP